MPYLSKSFTRSRFAVSYVHCMLFGSSHSVIHLLPFCGEPRERFTCSLVRIIWSVGVFVYLSVRLSVYLLAYLLVHPFNYARSFVCWSVYVFVLSYVYSVHFHLQLTLLLIHPALHIYKQIVHAISVGRVLCITYHTLYWVHSLQLFSDFNFAAKRDCENELLVCSFASFGVYLLVYLFTC